MQFFVSKTFNVAFICNFGGIGHHFYALKEFVWKLELLKIKRVVYYLYLVYLKNEKDGLLELFMRTDKFKVIIFSFPLDWCIFYALSIAGIEFYL